MIITWNSRVPYVPWQAIDGNFEYNILFDDFDKKESCSILHEMNLNKGYKIKAQARIIRGSHAETAPRTVRIRIMKVSK